MTPAEFIDARQRITDRQAILQPSIDALDVAHADRESDDPHSDAVAEAIFLRAFTAYEADLEGCFFHYLMGGLCLRGREANSYLRGCDEATARKIVKGGLKFISWAKPSMIRQTSEMFLRDGWPIVPTMAAKNQELADCERIRNRIAHNSLEAQSEFGVVQRNLLTTERLFPLSPGQLLRIRHRRIRKTHLGHLIDVMRETIEAIMEP